MNRARLIKLCIALIVPLIVLLIPREAIPIDGLTVTMHRVLAIFALALCLWVLEPIPIFATSMVVIVLELLVLSNKGLVWARPTGEVPADFGTLLDYKDIMATMADPIIMLFLGGFFLGAAATKFQMDNNLGRVLLKPFGTRTIFVLLGMMVVTAIFSMFMSNTATTAMMLAVLMPVLRSIDADDPSRIGFALAIPFAANIGGIGTPIGTPPNAVGLKYLRDAVTDQPLISFAEWMVFAVPFVVVLLLITWGILVVMFRPAQRQLVVKFQGRWLKSPQAWIVYVTSSVTILLWLTGSTLHGMPSTVVALIPVAVFCATGIMTSQDIKGLSWDVLWLVAGGFALGQAMETTGLGAGIVASIPFDNFHPVLIVSAACLLTFIMANFMSHTASANLMLPIMAALGVSLTSLVPFGGQMMLILAVTFTASLSMVLPISTPPNAMAYATGWIRTPDMTRAGLGVGIIGLVLVAIMSVVLNMLGFFDR